MTPNPINHRIEKYHIDKPSQIKNCFPETFLVQKFGDNLIVGIVSEDSVLKKIVGTMGDTLFCLGTKL